MSRRFYLVLFAGIGLSLATAEIGQAQGVGRARGGTGRASAGARAGGSSGARAGGVASRGNTGSARGGGVGQSRGNAGQSRAGVGTGSARGVGAGVGGSRGGIASRVRPQPSTQGRNDQRIQNPGRPGTIGGIGSAGGSGRNGGGARNGGDGSRGGGVGTGGSRGGSGIGSGGSGNRGGIGSGSRTGGGGVGVGGSRGGTGVAGGGSRSGGGIGSPGRGTGGPIVVPPRPGTGVAYGTRYPSRDRFDRDWMYDSRGWSLRLRGPSYCRTGIGHPTFGRSWCASRGYGLGNTRDLFWISVGWGRFSLQFGRVTRVRSWGGWHDLDQFQLSILLGPALFGRISSHGFAFGWQAPLAGVWFGDPYDGYSLRIYSGVHAVAELYDWDCDGWVDDIRLIRPY